MSACAGRALCGIPDSRQAWPARVRATHPYRVAAGRAFSCRARAFACVMNAVPKVVRIVAGTFCPYRHSRGSMCGCAGILQRQAPLGAAKAGMVGALVAVSILVLRRLCL